MVDGSSMSAAECRIREGMYRATAEECIAVASAENATGFDIGFWNRRAERALKLAADWRAAALEAEQREAGSRGDR